MKIDNYAISVQWGEGFHYFIGYRETYADARLFRMHTELTLKRSKKKRGAKPKVYIWELK